MPSDFLAALNNSIKNCKNRSANNYIKRRSKQVEKVVANGLYLNKELDSYEESDNKSDNESNKESDKKYDE